MKKDVSGVAGAARIKNVDHARLARAEKHGKRLDKTGQARAVNDAPPITTTGLGLRGLLDKHVDGAFVPKSKSRAMHLLIQFPTDLVDGEDANYMLRHARAFTERVFGDDSIFADRIDRDEKSRHVVDLFVAPRYNKVTKRESKPAVSMTRHLKALANEYGENPLPPGCGRALQTAFFEYMRDVMQLETVERGKAKAIPGNDWKSAEQQRSDEMDNLATELQAQREQVERDQASARAYDAAARSAADAQALSVANDRLVLDGDRKALDSRQAELAQRERQVQEAEDALRMARAEVQRRQDDLTVAQDVATRAAEMARDRAIAAMKASAAAETDRLEAARLTSQADADRIAMVNERSWRQAELALLLRASDDGNRLHLRRAGSDITMNEAAMDHAELTTYRRPWPAPVRALAMRLAVVLEQVRELARSLLDREARVIAKEAMVAVQEREMEERRAAQQIELEQALSSLRIREEAATVSSADAKRRAAAADKRITAAAQREKDATETLVFHQHWAKAVELIGRRPSILIHDDEGSFRLDPRPERIADQPNWLVTTLQKPAPTWASAAIKALHERELAIERVEAREDLATGHLRELQDMIAAAGPSLQPAQKAIVDQATKIIDRAGTALSRQDDGHAI